MKNLSRFLIALIMGITLTFCGNDKSSEEKSENALSQIPLGSSFIITDVTPMIANYSDINEYRDSVPKRNSRIDWKVARAKLNAFKVWADFIDNGQPDLSIEWSKVMYGFVYDFDSLYSYLDSLKKINDDPTVHDSLKIDGIRVYLGADYYKSGFVPSVFLFPTKNNKNIRNIDLDYPSFLEEYNGDGEAIIEALKNELHFEGDGSGYNNSLPCPQTCP
ncbi:hypothetical protein [Marinoscillum sp.]|uniref:hypothetical protein n=1 Tax=Marinoscillum sp. TaxID=2024838 RepID=UPI003BA96E73